MNGKDTSSSDATFWDSPVEEWPSTRSNFLSASRLLAYSLITISLIPFQIFGLLIWPWLAQSLPIFHHRLSAAIIGLKIVRKGHPLNAHSVLFVSNHVSYFDIIALGAIIPGSFVAKSDVSRWPVFGTLAKLTRTVFIDRNPKSTFHQLNQIRRRLQSGDRLILFPEGTSSDGTRVLPFKSAVFESAQKDNVLIQPVTLNYTRLNGIPMGRALRPLLAWYGDMELVPHLWAALSLGSQEISITFHAPVTAQNFSNRKTLARHCRKTVADGMGTNSIQP